MRSARVKHRTERCILRTVESRNYSDEKLTRHAKRSIVVTIDRGDAVVSMEIPGAVGKSVHSAGSSFIVPAGAWYSITCPHSHLEHTEYHYGEIDAEDAELRA